MILPGVIDLCRALSVMINRQEFASAALFESCDRYGYSTALQLRLERTTTFFQWLRPASLYGSGVASDPPP